MQLQDVERQEHSENQKLDIVGFDSNIDHYKSEV